MKYSIIIATINRSNLINKCIESVMLQSYKNYEIIVVDQSSDTKTKKIVEKYDDVRYINIMPNGLSNARNIGVKFAKGDYICLLDDDAEYDKNFLENINGFLSNNKVAIIGGKVKDKITGQVFLKEMNDSIIKLTEDIIENYLVSSALVIDSKLLSMVNGFDEKFGAGSKYGSAEETDLILRIYYKDNNIYYYPDAIVYHPYEEKEDVKLSKIYSYGVGYGALVKKHSTIYKNKVIKKKYNIKIIKQVIAIISFNIIKLDRTKVHLNRLKGIINGYKTY
ncbi:glycosyltransferase family 2 protein [Clostridium sardiniense]|uniref:glycosyltransferase family 2 protein n=1 Tax=Clostridium sardiniense TaxID=29369 RepID=UPI003D348600